MFIIIPGFNVSRVVVSLPLEITAKQFYNFAIMMDSNNLFEIYDKAYITKLYTQITDVH